MDLSTLHYLTDDGVDAPEGLATDEYLLEEQGEDRDALPTLRLYTYRSHCALVGRFQDVEAEVDLAECDRLEIQVNRRPTGGGAILMGADQLGVALTGTAADVPSRAVLSAMAEGVRAGLAAVGIDAELRGKNDLAVDGRKIAGLGVCRNERGGFLFHASVLWDLDIELMLRVLRIPVEKMGGDAASFVGSRLTTVARQASRSVTVDELRGSIREGFAQRFGAQIVPRSLETAAREAIAASVRDKYGTQAWVRERAAGSEPAGVGYARAEGGLVRAQVALAGGAIKAAYLSADFVDAPDDLLPAIEARLRWGPATEEAISRAVTEAWPGSEAPDAVSPAHLVRALMRAADAAAISGAADGSYACYVGRLEDGGERADGHGQ